MRNPLVRVVPLALTAALVASACGTESAAVSAGPAAAATTTTTTTTVPPTTTTTVPPTTTTTVPPTTTTTTTTTVAPTTTTVPPSPAEQATMWAYSYVGGSLEPATGEPYFIGYVNQDEFFPDATIGLDAAVRFVNQELGGIGGRPIQLVPCRVVVEADGARCGAELAANPAVSAVMTGGLLQGNADLYTALQGAKPVIVSTGVTPDDFLTTAGVSFLAGPIGVIEGLGIFAVEKLDPRPAKVAIVRPDTTGARFLTEQVLLPFLAAAGVEATQVPVTDLATAQEVAVDIQIAFAEDADTVIAFGNVGSCINLHGALGVLGISPRVVAGELCDAPAMAQYLEQLGAPGPLPDRWFLGGWGYSFHRPDLDSGMFTYLTKLGEYVPAPPDGPPYDPTGYAAPTFSALLTLVRIANGLGDAAADPVALDAAVRAFTGPAMLQAGGLRCGVVPVVTVCGHFIGVEQYVGGQWVSVADALNGAPIDVRTG